MNLRLCRSVIVALFLCTLAVAQEANKFAMERITFKGTSRFSDAQLLGYLGMKVGAPYSQTDLQGFATKLNSAGVFTQVSYRFAPTWAEFEVKDNPRLLPMRLENIVWLSQVELDRELKARVPLYTTGVPLEGELADQVARAIEAVLKEKGVDATVQQMPFEEEGSGLDAVSYRVVQPKVEFGSFAFQGAGEETSAALMKAVASTVGTEFNWSSVHAIADHTLPPVMQEHGFLRASFSTPNAKPASASGAAVTRVAVVFTVLEGAQYHIGKLALSNPDPMVQESAKRLSQIKTGEVANMVAFRKQLSELGGEFLAKGYMGAKVHADPIFDDAAHTVSYNIAITPGDLYRARDVEMKGFDEAHLEQIRSVWKLKKGDVYDPSYARNFLKTDGAKIPFLQGYVCVWTQKISDDDKAVDLTLEFKKPQGIR